MPCSSNSVRLTCPSWRRTQSNAHARTPASSAVVSRKIPASLCPWSHGSTPWKRPTSAAASAFVFAHPQSIV